MVGEATGGFSYERIIWRPSPDSEEIRQHLLDLLTEIDSTAAADSYIAFPRVTDIVVWQLGEFREQRAVETLQRLADEMPGESAALVLGVLKRIREGDA